MSDLISRQAAVNAIITSFEDLPIAGQSDLVHIIKALPSVSKPLTDKADVTWIHVLDQLRRKLYQKCMVEDSEDVKWDSGCWVRYWLIEDAIEEVAIEIVTGEEES